MSIVLNSRGSTLNRDNDLNSEKNRMKSSHASRIKVEIPKLKIENHKLEDKERLIMTTTNW